MPCAFGDAFQTKQYMKQYMKTYKHPQSLKGVHHVYVTRHLYVTKHVYVTRHLSSQTLTWGVGMRNRLYQSKSIH